MEKVIGNSKYVESLSRLHSFAIIGFKVYMVANGNTYTEDVVRTVVGRDYNVLLEYINGNKMWGYDAEDLAKVALAVEKTGISVEELMKKNVLAEILLEIYKKTVDNAIKDAANTINKRFGGNK